MFCGPWHRHWVLWTWEGGERRADPRVRTPAIGGVFVPGAIDAERSTHDVPPFCRCVAVFIASLVTASVSRSAVAADASLNGKVLDQLGAPIDRAKVTLLRDGQRVNDTTSDARGEFTFDGLVEGRYQVEVIAEGFEPRTSDAVFVEHWRTRDDSTWGCRSAR